MADPVRKASIGITNPSPPRHHAEPDTLPPRPSRPPADGQAIIDELRLLRTAIEASKKSRQRDVAVGVFFGLLALFVLVWLIGAGLFELRLTH